MFKDVYYSKKTEKYYYNGLVPCNSCLKWVDQLIFIERTYNKTNREIRFFCRNCISKRKHLPNIYADILICVVVDKLPGDCFPVFDSSPTLSNFKGEETVFTITNKNIDGEKVIDKTIQSHNVDFMRMEGIKSESKLLDDLNKSDDLLRLEDVNKFASEDVVLLGSRFELEDKEEREKELAFDKMIEENVLRKKGLLK